MTDTKTIGPYTLVTTPYEWFESPRNHDDLLGKICTLRLWEGPDMPFAVLGQNGGWAFDEAAFERYMRQEGEEVALLIPLWVYRHGCTAYAVGWSNPFYTHYGFDSGRTGWVYVTKDAIRKHYKVKRVTKRMLELAEELVKVEIQTYSHYVNNDGTEVWYYEGEDEYVRNYIEGDPDWSEDEALAAGEKWLRENKAAEIAAYVEEEA